MDSNLTTIQSRRALLFIYLLSGAAALSYEVLWARMFSTVLGVSIFGVVVTVAAFLAGLGLGSAWATHWSSVRATPLRLFALLEAAVAIYAVSLPAVLPEMERLVDWVTQGRGLAAWYALEAIAAFILLLLPALAMGIGFPLILRAGAAVGASVRQVYGLNTVGAALGALLPLAMLPAFGWSTSLRITAGLGMVVVVAALWLAEKLPAQAVAEKRESVRPSTVTLLAYAAVGAAALMLQVGWTRLFGILLLRTEYVLAAILATYLAGVGFGSLLSGWLERRRAFAALPVVATLGVACGLWALEWLAAWSESNRYEHFAGALLAHTLVIALFTLPVTATLGAWLPLLNKRAGDSSHSAAWLYAANSLGGAAGAVCAGFLLLESIGTTATVALAGLALTVVSAAWVSWRRVAVFTGVAALALWPVVAMPPIDRLMPITHGGERELYRYEDAIAYTNVTANEQGHLMLLTDLQRMDASSEPTALELQKNQARLPLLLYPQASSVLFLGLGTGISAAGSLAFPLSSRTAVELSEGSITAAAGPFAEANDHVMADLRVVRDDARRFLRRERRRYDVIVGDVFHPDLAGRSALLSVEQFQRVRARLASHGIYAQWIALNQFDSYALDVVLRTFADVFPGALLFADGFRLCLVGPRDGALDVQAAIRGSAEFDPARSDAMTGGEGLWTWLGRYWGTIRIGDGPRQSEWRPRIEFHLPRARFSGTLDLPALLSHLLNVRPAFEQAARQLGLDAAQTTLLERPFIASELAYRGWVAELDNAPGEAQRLSLLAFQANPHDRWISYGLADALWNRVQAGVESQAQEREILAAILRIRADYAPALSRLQHLDSSRDQPGLRQAVGEGASPPGPMEGQP